MNPHLKYKIESHHPIPSGYAGNDTELLNTMKKLEPGESILLLSEKERNRARAISRALGIKIITRGDPENTHGFRLWRVLSSEVREAV